MSRTCIALTVAAAILSLSGSEATASSPDTNRSAYTFAMKCFVANGIARGNSRDAGNAAQANDYEARARESFDVASKLGETLGYSGSRVSQDFGMAQTEEMPKMVRDKPYLSGSLAACKSAGL